MLARSWFSLGFAAFVLAAPLSSTAWACPPPLPGLYSSVPKDGDTYPGNAVLFFSGHEISLDTVTVTVGGSPAAFVPATGVVPAGLGGILVTIDPPPAAGQAVAITGDFCLPGAGCSPESIQYTAAAPDTTAPAPASALSFDIYDYLDFKSSGGDCQFDSDIGWWVTIDGAPAGPGEAPVIYVVEAFRDMNLQDLAFSKATFVSASTTRLAFRQLLTLLNGVAPPDALCFQVSAFDAAGNAQTASPLVVCKPCHYRVDNDTPDPFLPPPEPMWTAADVFPGGMCAIGTTSGTGGGAASGAGTGGSGAGTGGSGAGTGGSGTGGLGPNNADPTSEGGCTCRTTGQPASSTWMLSAVAAAAGVLRRRRRRPG